MTDHAALRALETLRLGAATLAQEVMSSKQNVGKYLRRLAADVLRQANALAAEAPEPDILVGPPINWEHSVAQQTVEEQLQTLAVPPAEPAPKGGDAHATPDRPVRARRPDMTTGAHERASAVRGEVGTVPDAPASSEPVPAPAPEPEIVAALVADRDNAERDRQMTTAAWAELRDENAALRAERARLWELAAKWRREAAEEQRVSFCADELDAALAEGQP